MEGISPIKVERTNIEQAHFNLAHMLDWYRREKKSFWCEFFRLKELPEDQEGNKPGSTHEIDTDAGILRIRKGPKKKYLPHPLSVISLENVNSSTKEESIIKFAEWVLDNSMDSSDEKYRSTRQMLMNVPPNMSEKLTHHLRNKGQSYYRSMLHYGLLPVGLPLRNRKS